ncbi:NADPH-dependent alpha-keto amide reductase [[Candida] railenensis]|uniref:2-dehydropantolactone reductase n=1 Tax=[Candida] railenensis TaxID=45579 RepID=A0A9P0QMZ0_9ASCO|nr:NADPH-dependent alpha-keto amide reductase [[Candida] railenensis]
MTVQAPFKTKSGIPITIGTGSGSIWKDRKRANPENKEIPKEIISTIESSLLAGFNHIDSSEAYNTYDEVRQAIESSGKKREDLWLTTKYVGGSSRWEAPSKGPRDALEIALKALNTDYIDLYLIHHPFLDPVHSYGYTIEKTWAELVSLKDSGKVREIGVSNFRVQDLERIFNIPDVKYAPVVNQIEFHPYLQDQSPGILDFSQKHNILVEAYGPLTPIFRIKDTDSGELKTDHPLVPVLEKLSSKYGKTPAQILLRYTLQRGVLPITTSSNKERQKQSIEVYEFELDTDDVEEITKKGSEYFHRGSFVGLF